jgi:outer membrane protein OmpA-like peptidoglycan-associated protein
MFFGMNRRKEEQYEEPNYWISFTDFALSFLISFILLSALMLADQYKQKIKLEKSMEIIQENYAVRINIAKVLEEEFKNDDSVFVDPSSGVMRLKENAIEFYPDKSTLKSNPEYIDNIFSKYINALQRATSPNGEINYYEEDYVQRIIIEGHVHETNAQTTTGMGLSQDRALTVYNQIYPQIRYDNKLKEKVQAVGRGHFIPYGDGTNDSANRRVEFHFTLNEEKIATEQSNAIANAQEESTRALFE